MKKIFFVLMLMINISAYSQDFLDSIAKQSCECIEEKLANTDINKKNINTHLGLCLIAKSMNYKEELKEKYDVDISNMYGDEGSKLGRLIGIKMVAYCPNVFSQIAEKKGDDEDGEILTTEGKIDDITKNQFYTIYLLDNNNKRISFLWLYDFDNSSSLLKEISLLKGKKINITYSEMNLFDANNNEPRTFKIIDKIEWEYD